MSDKPTTAELITMLREFDCHTDVQELAADRLEAAAPPKWTEITDNPKTWPPVGESVVCRTGEGGKFYYGHSIFDRLSPADTSFYSGINSPSPYLKYTHWRPLCDLDYPIEQKP